MGKKAMSPDVPGHEPLKREKLVDDDNSRPQPGKAPVLQPVLVCSQL